MLGNKLNSGFVCQWWVGIIETGNESKRWLEKIANVFDKYSCIFGAAYFLYPMLQYIFKSLKRRF